MFSRNWVVCLLAIAHFFFHLLSFIHLKSIISNIYKQIHFNIDIHYSYLWYICCVPVHSVVHENYWFSLSMYIWLKYLYFLVLLFNCIWIQIYIWIIWLHDSYTIEVFESFYLAYFPNFSFQNLHLTNLKSRIHTDPWLKTYNGMRNIWQRWRTTQ